MGFSIPDLQMMENGPTTQKGKRSRAPSGEEMIEPENAPPPERSRPLITERAEEGVEVEDSGDGQVYGARGGAIGPPRLAAEPPTPTPKALTDPKNNPLFEDDRINRYAAIGEQGERDRLKEEDDRLLGMSYEDYAQENPGATRSDYAQARQMPFRRNTHRTQKSDKDKQEKYESYVNTFGEDSDQAIQAQADMMGIDTRAFGGDMDLVKQNINARLNSQNKQNGRLADRLARDIYKRFTGITGEDAEQLKEMVSIAQSGSPDMQEAALNEIRMMRKDYYTQDAQDRRRNFEAATENRAMTREMQNPYANRGMAMRSLTDPNSTPQQRAAVYSALGMHDAAAAELELAGIQAQGDAAVSVADANANAAKDTDETGEQVEKYNKQMDGYVASGDFQGAQAHATAAGQNPSMVVGRFANGGNLAPVEGLLKSEFDSIRNPFGFGVFDLDATRNDFVTKMMTKYGLRSDVAGSIFDRFNATL